MSSELETLKAVGVAGMITSSSEISAMTGSFEIAYGFVLVSTMGIFGSLSGILYSGKKLSFKEVLANMFIACFVAVIMKLTFFDYKNNFLLLAVIGVLCFNTRQAISVISLIPSVFFKTGILKNVIESASKEINNSTISKTDNTDTSNSISNNIDNKDEVKKHKSALSSNDKCEEKIKNITDNDGENKGEKPQDACEYSDYSFCQTCSNQEKLLVLKRKKIYEQSKMLKGKSLSRRRALDSKQKQ